MASDALFKCHAVKGGDVVTERDTRRLFRQDQRKVLFSLAEGRCQICSAELGEDWNADHRIPWSEGGPTTIENGQAVCGPCNTSKGTGSQYADEFQARPFQREVLFQALERIQEKQRFSVVLASPGSGKTLAYQALATHLFRLGLIDYVAVFAPRIALAVQCETTWMWVDLNKQVHGMCHLFDPAKRFGRIRHKIKETPLTKWSEPGTGFVATYCSLVHNESVFMEWGREHRGRFLLVADEAQFCGSNSDDREDGGTKSGALVEQLHEYALHTVLLTGTPYRADGQPLILADYESDPDDPKKRILVSHAQAKYSDGIAEGYLRTFELHRTDSRVSKRTLGDPCSGAGDRVLEYNLSDDGSELVPVLRDEDVWKPLVDRVVAKVRDKQKFHASYRGLISCIEQRDAKKVKKYLEERYPALRVGLAVSSETDAAQTLEDFKHQPMDILVTVRMAFIGYDCPQITVVGILTNYRHSGHLSQLVGRGLRVWKEGPPPREQSCVIVAPDDPKMEEFLRYLREEEQQGLAIIERREPGEPDGPGGTVQEEISYIDKAYATNTRASDNERNMEASTLTMIEGLKVAVDSGEDATKLLRLLDLAGLAVQEQVVPDPRSAPPAPPPQ
ncbi:HNH endonuclease, partial [Streptomyces rimosus]